MSNEKDNQQHQKERDDRFHHRRNRWLDSVHRNVQRNETVVPYISKAEKQISGGHDFPISRRPESDKNDSAEERRLERRRSEDAYIATRRRERFRSREPSRGTRRSSRDRYDSRKGFRDRCDSRDRYGSRYRYRSRDRYGSRDPYDSRAGYDSRDGYDSYDSYDDDEESVVETEEERRKRWEIEWERTKHEHPPRPFFVPLDQLKRRRKVLEIEYWERTPLNADRKQAHMDQLDRVSGMSREQWILNTTLLNQHITIEPNLFPYETPAGVTHHTLWSRTYLCDDEVESYVEQWLDEHRPSVQAWAWDPSNLSEGMSVDLYHVHVFIWEPPKTRATFKNTRSRSHRALLPLPPPSTEPVSPRQKTMTRRASRKRFHSSKGRNNRIEDGDKYQIGGR